MAHVFLLDVITLKESYEGTDIYESYINKSDKNLNAKCRPALYLEHCHQNTEESHIFLRYVRFVSFYFMPS